MITVVRLTNWRAYRNVTLQLERGTTFLVASNGVGKSSLIEAVQWVLDRTKKPTAEPIRKGTRSAAVELEIDAGDSSLRIRRTLDLGDGVAPRKTPKDETITWADGVLIGADDFFDRLSAHWGADSGFVSRTAFLTDDLINGSAEPELRTHLCQAFALDRLRDSINQLLPHISGAGKDAEAARSTERQTEGELQEAERAVSDAASEIADVQQRADRLRSEDATAAQVLATAETTLAQLQRLQTWQSEHEKLVEQATALIGPLPLGAPLLAVLRTSEVAATQQLDQLKEDRARLAERMRATVDALARLLAAGGECPVCRRPLDDNSRGNAQTQHEHDQAEANAHLTAIDLDAPSTIAEQLHNLVTRAERLGDAPDAPAAADIDIASAAEEARLARAALETALGELGSAKSGHNTALTKLADVRAKIESAASVPALYRKQGILEAAKEALEGTIDEVLQQQLGPISDEVNRRWDAVFSDRPGLRVDADGQITRVLDDEHLDFDSFSAGEKTVARLLFRLATLVTTTKVPFCWIDEPLEHLDPYSRTVVARTLALLSEQGYLDQTIVTTYEEDLAIKLSQSERDHVRLEYLATSQVRV